MVIIQDETDSKNRLRIQISMAQGETRPTHLRNEGITRRFMTSAKQAKSQTRAERTRQLRVAREHCSGGVKAGFSNGNLTPTRPAQFARIQRDR
jgi:hypothetical protein